MQIGSRSSKAPRPLGGGATRGLSNPLCPDPTDRQMECGDRLSSQRLKLRPPAIDWAGGRPSAARKSRRSLPAVISNSLQTPCIHGSGVERCGLTGGAQQRRARYS